MLWYEDRLNSAAMKKEIALLAAVALGSLALGFLIVYLVLGAGRSQPLPDPFTEAGGEVPAGPVEPQPQTKQAPEQAPAVQVAPPEQEPPETPSPAQPAPESPQPAPVPAGKLDMDVGDPYVWRCWAEGEAEPYEKDRCGTLPGIEKFLAENLGLVETCVLDNAGEKAGGKLSLALKVDFGAGTVNAWLGNSTTVAGVEAISGCLRIAFAARTPPAIAHDFPRYIIFFTIDVK